MRDNVVIDFGKHKGKPLSEVPAEYLRWVLLEFDKESFGGWVRKYILAELEQRAFTLGEQSANQPPQLAIVSGEPAVAGSIGIVA
jgi:hypothetical protein